MTDFTYNGDPVILIIYGNIENTISAKSPQVISLSFLLHPKMIIIEQLFLIQYLGEKISIAIIHIGKDPGFRYRIILLHLLVVQIDSIPELKIRCVSNLTNRIRFSL